MREFVLVSLRGITCCVPDAREIGVVLGIGTMDVGDVRETPAMQQAYDLGASICG
ncbi:hypothetical protein [Paratractidigestivibacter sp.]|uniref:hypothetical protein n=1 Tax=Paratractidigestivibacter sp. TaxID=2847316 RepID=UPI002AC9901B|nr:hypothetical protein [Paratractidigestivibacter sp.]